MFENERSQIDTLDTQIAKLLEERMEQVEKIAALKKASGVVPLDAGREKKVLDNAKKAVINARYHEYVELVFKHMMAESRAFQQKVIERDSKKEMQ